MFHVIFIFSDGILIKQIIVSTTPLLLALGGNRFSKNCTWSFEWGTGSWVKMRRFCSFSTINWKFFQFEGASEKGFVEIEDWGFSLHFALGFQEDSIYTLHLCLKIRYYIENGGKFLQKLTPGLKKITWGTWATSDRQWKVQKVEIWWATFVQKIHSFS